MGAIVSISAFAWLTSKPGPLVSHSNGLELSLMERVWAYPSAAPLALPLTRTVAFPPAAGQQLAVQTSGEVALLNRYRPEPIHPLPPLFLTCTVVSDTSKVTLVHR